MTNHKKANKKLSCKAEVGVEKPSFWKDFQITSVFYISPDSSFVGTPLLFSKESSPINHLKIKVRARARKEKSSSFYF